MHNTRNAVRPTHLFTALIFFGTLLSINFSYSAGLNLPQELFLYFSPDAFFNAAL
jgi:hypothetical protein